MDKVWCEHMDNYKSEKWYLADKEFQFCPVCGTPKPKEESLEEKFETFWNLAKFNNQTIFKDLASVARKHFKDGGV